MNDESKTMKNGFRADGGKLIVGYVWWWFTMALMGRCYVVLKLWGWRWVEG